MGENATKKPLLSKGFVWVLTVVVVLFAVAMGMGIIAAELGKFGSDAMLAPLRLMWTDSVWVKLSVLVSLGLLGLIIGGLSKRKFWYLAPLGVMLVGAYWLLASARVVVMIQAIRG
jgi:hypothetical protein